MDELKEAVEKKDMHKIKAISANLSNDDIIYDLVVKGHLKESLRCTFCNKSLGYRFMKYGVGLCCFKEFAQRIIREGSHKKIGQIIAEFRREKFHERLK